MTAQILLITDQPDIGRFWAYTLRQRGLVCTESSPEEQLSRRKQSPWDAAIIDLYGRDTLPVQLCKTLHSRADGPILLLWDAYDEASILKAYEAGAAEVVQRPISPLLLTVKLAAWLRRTGADLDDAESGLGRTADSGR